MKKKNNLSKKDQKDWNEFIEDLSQVPDKDKPHKEQSNYKKFRYDLHGLTLDEANQKVKEIILSCSKKNLREIILITGKGLHSNSQDVYKSIKLSKLRYSVPEFINSDSEISKLVLSINTSSPNEGGQGALQIKLKKL